jgi:hypothetical protein
MIRLIAAIGFALVVTTSAQAMIGAPRLQPNSSITQVGEGCGFGKVWLDGKGCVSRASVRQDRRCVRWSGKTCEEYK